MMKPLSSVSTWRGGTWYLGVWPIAATFGGLDRRVYVGWEMLDSTPVTPFFSSADDFSTAEFHKRFDLALCQNALGHDLAGAKLVPAMNKIPWTQTSSDRWTPQPLNRRRQQQPGDYCENEARPVANGARGDAQVFVLFRFQNRR